MQTIDRDVTSLLQRREQDRAAAALKQRQDRERAEQEQSDARDAKELAIAQELFNQQFAQLYATFQVEDRNEDAELDLMQAKLYDLVVGEDTVPIACWPLGAIPMSDCSTMSIVVSVVDGRIFSTNYHKRVLEPLTPETLRRVGIGALQALRVNVTLSVDQLQRAKLVA